MKLVRAWSLLVLIVPPLGACAAESVVARRETHAPPATASPPPADASAPERTPQELSDTLARAYASQDEEAVRAVARALESRAPEATSDAGAPAPEAWTTSEDGERFAVVAASGLYWGKAKEVHIDAFLPGVEGNAHFLSDPKWLVVRKPPPVGSDSMRLEWSAEDQPYFLLIDVAERRIALKRPGRVVGASPNCKSLLVSDGNETKLSFLDVDTLAERSVSFDVAAVRAPNPNAWRPTNCEEDRCAEGAPFPWNLRSGDVSFSQDGSIVALNWNGFSRGSDQGVTVHDVHTGAMVASFASMTRATTTFAAKGSNLAVLISSKKAPPPYHTHDTALVFHSDHQDVRKMTGCTFATGTELTLALSPDDARLAVSWRTAGRNMMGPDRAMEACVFDASGGRSLGKIPPGDARHDAFHPKSEAGAADFEQMKAGLLFLRERGARTCVRSGYLLPRKACGPERSRDDDAAE